MTTFCMMIQIKKFVKLVIMPVSFFCRTFAPEKLKEVNQ